MACTSLRDFRGCSSVLVRDERKASERARKTLRRMWKDVDCVVAGEIYRARRLHSIGAFD